MATTLQDITKGFDVLASGDGTGLQAKQPHELKAYGTSEGAVAGWQTRGKTSGHQEGDTVHVHPQFDEGGKSQKGTISQSAPSGKFHGVTDSKGKFLGYYHESDLSSKPWTSGKGGPSYKNQFGPAAQLEAGGPGSGCHGPNCGRHGGGKGTDKTHVPKSATVKDPFAPIKVGRGGSGKPSFSKQDIDKEAQQGRRQIAKRARGIETIAQRLGNKGLVSVLQRIQKYAKSGNDAGIEKLAKKINDHAEKHTDKQLSLSDRADYAKDGNKASQFAHQSNRHGALAEALDELHDDIRYGWGQ